MYDDGVEVSRIKYHDAWSALRSSFLYTFIFKTRTKYIH